MPNDAETASPSEEKGRSLAGFYITVGVIAALVLLGTWLWTPAKITYWEWQARRGGDGPITPGRQHALGALLQMGPPAQPALGRLLRSPHSNLRREIVDILYAGVNQRDLPLIVIAAQCNDPRVARHATDAAWKVLYVEIEQGRVGNFAGPRELLDWWEREGRARYEARYGKVPE
jgi:hypothetical protein